MFLLRLQKMCLGQEGPDVIHHQSHQQQQGLSLSRVQTADLVALRSIQIAQSQCAEGVLMSRVTT